MEKVGGGGGITIIQGLKTVSTPHTTATGEVVITV